MPPSARRSTAAANRRHPVAGVGPVIRSGAVRFRLPDHQHADGVRLEVDFSLPAGPSGADFQRRDGGWSLRLPRLEVDRIEYQLTVRTGDDWHWMTDPGNPRRVANPFGDKSEVRFPGYTEPRWLITRPTGTLGEIHTPAGGLAEPVPVRLWSAAGLPTGAPAPLLVAHDGSDMAERGSLLRWAASLPVPIRVALLDPPLGRRDDWYSADDTYTDHLAAIVLPALAGHTGVGPVIGLGASLGAVAMLHLHQRHPNLLAGLALQSGSFFTVDHDPQERGFSHFDRVSAFVAQVKSGERHGAERRPVPVLMTCGLVEENRSNNEAMAGVLAEHGHPVDLRLVRDAHTMIGWRDAWAPGLDELVRHAAPQDTASHEEDR